MNNAPWEEYSHIWKTKAAFMSFLRGGIRRALWNRSPIKLEFIRKNRIRIPNPNPRGRVAEVWGAICGVCGGEFLLKDVEVDHTIGNHSLKDLDDLQPFIEGIVCVSEGDLSFACKPCHKCKTHAEKMGISFDEAFAQKEAIKILKEKKDLTWLEERGIVPLRSQKARREQIVKQIIKERINESPE
jgi:5-methylcytosine-specific restriction endonuclease McrA